MSCSQNVVGNESRLRVTWRPTIWRNCAEIIFHGRRDSGKLFRSYFWLRFLLPVLLICNYNDAKKCSQNWSHFWLQIFLCWAGSLAPRTRHKVTATCVETLYSAFARAYKQGGMDGTSRQATEPQTSFDMYVSEIPEGHSTMAQRRYPPAVLIECVADIAQRHHKVPHLHLVIVDLWRSWKINQTQVRSLTGALRRLQHSAEDCTTPLSPQPGGQGHGYWPKLVGWIHHRSAGDQVDADSLHVQFRHNVVFEIPGGRTIQLACALTRKVRAIKAIPIHKSSSMIEAFQPGGGDLPWFGVVTCSCCS